jgi:bifunctional UDP-N-acetylglucosamine pyrophosphorylase/glucosamine-1-phosphate N-acetyltransferase
MRSETPKLLHEICGRPMIAWPLAAASEAGAGQIVVVEGPGRELEGALELGADLEGVLEFAVQPEPRGTADAVKAAADRIDGGTVIVMNGDHPMVSADTLRALAAAHEQSGAAATLATALLDDPAGYGRVIRGDDGSVERVVETKAPGDASEQELLIKEINTGIIAFDARELMAALDQVRGDNVQREQYLPDVIPILRATGRAVAAVQIHDAGSMLGINDRVALARVRALAQRRILDRHMLAGATIVDPAATVVDADVQIAPDAVIAPFSSLHGATVIGARATIGPLSTLIDATVGEDSRVLHSYVNGAEIGARVSVGPFAYLRPGTVLHEGAKAGTFVEIKNSVISTGAKVPHLSYIGDTEIGEQTNIGAGTITANYDGTRKHRTKIGARVKVSVDTMFVAPVAVGDDAYTAAGSVITKDVPPGALGVARARQQNITGYTERRKERDAQQPEEPDHAANEPARDSVSHDEYRHQPDVHSDRR